MSGGVGSTGAAFGVPTMSEVDGGRRWRHCELGMDGDDDEARVGEQDEQGAM